MGKIVLTHQVNLYNSEWLNIFTTQTDNIIMSLTFDPWFYHSWHLIYSSTRIKTWSSNPDEGKCIFEMLGSMSMSLEIWSPSFHKKRGMQINVCAKFIYNPTNTFNIFLSPVGKYLAGLYFKMCDTSIQKLIQSFNLFIKIWTTECKFSVVNVNENLDNLRYVVQKSILYDSWGTR